MKTASKSASSLVRLGAAALLLAVPALRAGSLWPAEGSARGIAADRKAAQIGDILTVVVSETVVAQSSQSKKDSRESSLTDAVGQFLFTPAASKLGTHNGQLPSTNITGKSSYSGGGEVNNTQSLTASAAVLVTDVLPGGNFVIAGVRMVTFSGETQYVVLRGLVRPDDIATDNTVLSSRIADARVEFVSEGSLTEAQKRGWLSKVYEKLRPF